MKPAATGIIAAILIVLGLGISSLSAALGPAGATVLCGPVDELTSILADQYGEKAIQQGTVTDDEYMAQLWRNPDTMSWTFVLLDTRGGACIFAAGDIWDLAPAVPIDPESTF